MVAGCIRPRTWSAPSSDDVAYICARSIGRANRVDCVPSLHSRPRSRSARLIGKMAWHDRTSRLSFRRRKVRRPMRYGSSFTGRNISSLIHGSFFSRPLAGYARPFLSSFSNAIKEARSCAGTGWQRKRSRVGYIALSGKSGKAKGSIETSDFRV